MADLLACRYGSLIAPDQSFKPAARFVAAGALLVGLVDLGRQVIRIFDQLQGARCNRQCKKIVNVWGTTVDVSCPSGPSCYKVGTVYPSDGNANPAGGQVHNCQWPATVNARITSIDRDQTCYATIEVLENFFGKVVNGICLGTYYVANNESHKNLANVGWSIGSGFASDEKGNNCFIYPGHNSTMCAGNWGSSCFANIVNDCHVQIDQSFGVNAKACPTAGTGN